MLALSLQVGAGQHLIELSLSSTLLARWPKEVTFLEPLHACYSTPTGISQVDASDYLSGLGAAPLIEGERSQPQSL